MPKKKSPYETRGFCGFSIHICSRRGKLIAYIRGSKVPFDTGEGSPVPPQNRACRPVAGLASPDHEEGKDTTRGLAPTSSRAAACPASSYGASLCKADALRGCPAALPARPGSVGQVPCPIPPRQGDSNITHCKGSLGFGFDVLFP